MDERKLKIALVQHAVNPSIDENLVALEGSIRQAAETGAKLIVLEELHNSLYFCQNENPDYFDLAETIPGPSTDFFGTLARELQCVIVTSLFEKRASGLYHNTAVVIDRDGSIAGRYRKMHIPDDPGYHEKFYFTPGDMGFTPIDTSVGRLGVLICWDQWYPEAARAMALAGAEILIYPTAIGWDTRDDEEERQRQLDSWVAVQRGHAVANSLPVVACNRVGHEQDPTSLSSGIRFWGHSFILGPQGESMAKAGEEECFIQAELDLNRSEEVRRIWPFLRDRRIDAYGDLLKRYID